MDKLKCNIEEIVENERLLQEQVRVFEEKTLRRKEKILKLEKDHRCIMEEKFQLKIKLQEYRTKEIKFVRNLIVL